MTATAPPLEGSSWLTSPAIDWRNTDGRIVVGVFWSAGCEASLLHLRRTLNTVEALDPTNESITLIAVHSPRFPYTEDQDVAAETLVRHGLDVLAVHDSSFISWNRYNPPGWPSTVVIDGAGRVRGMLAGPADPTMLQDILQTELSRPRSPRRFHRPRRRKDDRDRTIPTPTLSQLTTMLQDGTVEPDPSHVDLGLAYPSGLSISESGQVAIADQGNGRVLIGRLSADDCTLRVDTVLDGLDRPGDVAWASESALYVAEPSAGRVIGIDLDPGDPVDPNHRDPNHRDADRLHGGSDVRYVLADDLDRPTGLAVDRDGSLVVADAGREQLLRVVFAPDGSPDVGVIAGSGLSGSRDGPAHRASLAQPVAVARGQQGLLFCDAATSNLRVLTDRSTVKTITASGYFTFGLVDGLASRARLQRPSSLCILGDGSVLFADTGNDRLRLLTRRRIETLSLSGLRRPEAVATIAGHQALVADTANHRLVLIDVVRNNAWPLQIEASPRLPRTLADQDSSGFTMDATSSSSSSQ